MATATKTSIQPLEDRIVVTVQDSEQTTASGIVLPDTAKEKPTEGIIRETLDRSVAAPGLFAERHERDRVEIAVEPRAKPRG